jgi:hypothetical protein
VHQLGYERLPSAIERPRLVGFARRHGVEPTESKCRNAGGFEVHERGTRDPVALGGVALPFIGLATWLSGLYKLGRE